MQAKKAPTDASANLEQLDQLFLDCSELESLVASIKRGIDSLDPIAKSSALTVQHLMNLAYRIEAMERSLISVAHRVAETANLYIENHGKKTAST